MDSTPESNLLRRVSVARLMQSAALRHCLLVLLSYSLLYLVFFSPVMLRGSLLAVGGDGLYIYLPNFYSHKVLWDPLIFSGFPMMADPQVLTWYPPAFLLSLLPGTWNVFILMSYVVGSSFMYGYVHTLTRSRFAAFTSGLVFGLSGFMMAHLGHAVIIHVAAWIPLILWSLEALRQRLTVRWLVIGSVAVALCFLAGHSQIFVYGMLVAAGYVLVPGWSAPAGRWRYFSVSLLMVLVGVGLAAVQIIPSVELIRQSIRVGYPFHDFVAHALPPRQAFTLIFPMVFGHPAASGALPYFGRDNQTELTGYVGLLPLLLAAVGLVASKKKSLVLFWLCVALLALVLAMGDATPLARLLYHVPILNGFRAPARHFIELTVAVSVLSGLGVAAILQQQVSARLVRRVIVSSSLAMLACVVLLFMNAGYLNAVAAQKDIGRFSLLPWANSAVAVPIIVFLLAIAALSYWHKKPTSQFRRALLLFVLVIDLGSFGWFYEWRYVAPVKSALNAPENVSRYQSSLQTTNQRLISYRGYRGTTDEMPANLTRLWGVPNAAGYNVLILSRVGNLLPMIDAMGTPLPWSEPENNSLDLMAVRYLFLPRNESSTAERGVSWLKDDIQFWLGSGCTQPPRKSATVALPTPVKSTALSIVSRLACSSQIPDGTEVARVKLVDADGNALERSLVAGRDSSEWAYDCAAVKPLVRHRRANIFTSYPAKMYDEPCEGHLYVTTLPLDGVKDIKRVDFEWVNGQGAIILEKLTLVDDVSHNSYPIDPALIDDKGWRLVEEAKGARVYENLHAMPRAWLATEVINVNSEQALNTIKTGKLPDGRSFDPYRTALVEGPSTLNSPTVDSNGSATVATLTDSRMEVHTSSAARSFLITSDAYYYGWRAAIDGREAPLYRADYAIRGVIVPPGEHLVRFDYQPHSFYFGAMISALTLSSLVALALSSLFFRRRDS